MMQNIDAVAEIDRVLSSMADDLVPGAVSVGSRLIDDADLRALAADEAAIVANAVLRRRREFASGRVLLHQLIGSDLPIGVTSNRSPQLPLGWRGSLAHDATFAVAALSREIAIRSIGIDIEPMTVLSVETARVILRHDDSPIDTHLAFTLKEAAYKAQYAITRQIFDFHTLRIIFRGQQFTAEFCLDVASIEKSFQIDGRCAEDQSFFAAFCALPTV